MYCVLANDISISGIVTDQSNNPISSAIVRIQNLSLLDTTNENGVYLISKSITNISSTSKTKEYALPYITENNLNFVTINPGAYAMIVVYNCFGKQVSFLNHSVSRPGSHAVSLFNSIVPAQGVYLVKMVIEGKTYIQKVFLSGKTRVCQSQTISKMTPIFSTTRIFSAVDTIIVTATGYITKKTPLESYILNSVHITLDPIVNDTTPPIITILGANPLNIILGNAYVEHGAVALDNMDGDLSSEILINDNINISVLGTYATMYIVHDVAGNIAKAHRVVNVIQANLDTVPPVITLLGNNPMTLITGVTYVEPGAMATDNKDGNLSSSIIISGTVNSSVLDTYAIVYVVSDSSSNSDTATRYVYVIPPKDTVPPAITLNGSDTVSLTVGDVYNEEGATAFDNVDGNISSAIVIDSSTLNTDVAGMYSVLYTVSDQAGNQTQIVRIVVVVKIDDQPPILTLTGGNPVYFDKNDTYIEYGATAFDSVDGDLTPRIDTNISNIDMAEWGLYEAVYSVSDAKGNSATQKRKVRVDGIKTLLNTDNNNTKYQFYSHFVFKLPITSDCDLKIHVISGSGSYSVFEGPENSIVSGAEIPVSPDMGCVYIRITTDNGIRLRLQW